MSMCLYLVAHARFGQGPWGQDERRGLFCGLFGLVRLVRPSRRRTMSKVYR